MIKHNEDFKLEKLVWTTDDFEIMGWLDCEIHGIALDAENLQVRFDIDYIYAWAEPKPGIEYYSFWVSPCTLIFENVYDLKIDIESRGRLEIVNLTRGEESVPRNSEFINKQQEWQWMLECNDGDISFKSIGYTQYTRKKPQHINDQSFDKQMRGGVKFDAVSYL